MLGLENNVVYLDSWDKDSLKKSLNVAENIHINIDDTIEKLRPVNWEPRFEKVIEVAFDTSHIQNQIDRI